MKTDEVKTLLLLVWPHFYAGALIIESARYQVNGGGVVCLRPAVHHAGCLCTPLPYTMPAASAQLTKAELPATSGLSPRPVVCARVVRRRGGLLGVLLVLHLACLDVRFHLQRLKAWVESDKVWQCGWPTALSEYGFRDGGGGRAGSAPSRVAMCLHALTHLLRVCSEPAGAPRQRLAARPASRSLIGGNHRCGDGVWLCWRWPSSLTPPALCASKASGKQPAWLPTYAFSF